MTQKPTVPARLDITQAHQKWWLANGGPSEGNGASLTAWEAATAAQSEKLRVAVEALQDVRSRWVELRTALNKIAHPQSFAHRYGMSIEEAREIARLALVIKGNPDALAKLKEIDK